MALKNFTENMYGLKRPVLLTYFDAKPKPNQKKIESTEEFFIPEFCTSKFLELSHFTSFGAIPNLLERDVFSIKQKHLLQSEPRKTQLCWNNF